MQIRHGEVLGNAVAFDSAEDGTPWRNNLREYNQNLWQGKAKTILIRSQDGTPVAIYAQNEVEIFGTDVPKSTTICRSRFKASGCETSRAAGLLIFSL